ncbi:DUF3597 domain-containing protein (plasmid) [Morganella morganii]|uniref:DUF3597 domain-containing protein n=1 Tax=Morganella morganii TaxID=582 RepID=UPI0038657F9E
MSFFQDILSKVFKPTNTVTETGSESITALTESIKENANLFSDAVTDKKIDVMVILENLAANYPQKLNWKESIVDLLTLLGLDNSLTFRKNLAVELGYQGDTTDTATMNVWLIKEVIKKLDQASGNVSELAELLRK